LPQKIGAERFVQVILNVEDGTCSQADDCKDSAERPAARFAHSACAVNTAPTHQIYLFGGMGHELDYQDVYSWTPRARDDGLGL
jgi:Kelch motif